MYTNKVVMEAFKIYQILRTKGSSSKEEKDLYNSDNELRNLLEEWATEEQCTIIVTSSKLYLVPLAAHSPYHISNETIKKTYLKSTATNMDIYLMYFCVIVFIGAFYDSFNTTQATRDFILVDQWLKTINQRLSALAQHGDKLKEFEQADQYNWIGILEKWTSLDDINERAKSQKGNTSSRKNFLLSVVGFLKAQGLIEEKGEEELYLTEKTQVIVGRYFMEEEFNRGILEVIYGYEESVGE